MTTKQLNVTNQETSTGFYENSSYSVYTTVATTFTTTLSVTTNIPEDNSNVALIVGLSVGIPCGIAVIIAVIVTIICLLKRRTTNLFSSQKASRTLHFGKDQQVKRTDFHPTDSSYAITISNVTHVPKEDLYVNVSPKDDAIYENYPASDELYETTLTAS